jgi:NAD(P)H dehydrogenase (quinone)
MILITGATGRLGKAVVEQLARRTAPDQVAAFVRDESKASALRANGVKLCVGSYDDVASLDQAMRGVEKVLLVSGTEPNRIEQHQNVVDAAKRAGVTLIAYTSRVVKGQDASKNPLMAGHFATEEYIERSGLAYKLLRNALYLDVIPLFVGADKVFETGIHLPTGDGKVSYALRTELGEATANLLASDDVESRIHELTAHQSWSYHDVAEALSELSGKKVEYEPVAEEAFVAQMRQRGVPEAVVQRSADFHREVRSGLLDQVSLEMEQLLGRRPASLKDGLATLFHP